MEKVRELDMSKMNEIATEALWALTAVIERMKEACLPSALQWKLGMPHSWEALALELSGCWIASSHFKILQRNR
jgi:hypothetical protein